MNDVCPTEAKLVEFALSPLQEENIDIVMHVFHCEECSRKLERMNQVFLADCEVSPEEAAKIERFCSCTTSRAKQDGALWEKVQRLLTPVIFGDLGLAEDYRELPLVAASRKSFGNEKANDISTVRFVDLTFKANCDDCSNEFWKATLRIPLSAENETPLSVLVTDGKETPVATGTLVLCGRKLSVTNGKACTTLGDFRSSLRSREVAFCFASGKHMAGSLIFALEELK